MPELPEVETTRRGIEPHITNRLVTNVAIRQSKLRWPIPEQLPDILRGQKLTKITRRAKYLLFYFETGCLLVHLGMSGSLRVLSPQSDQLRELDLPTIAELPPAKHDHVDIIFDDQFMLRYNDPRRFGSMLWLTDAPEHHPLLKSLGPEPLDDDFKAQHLYEISKGRKINVKQFIMDQSVVTGVGNIYANEALFLSRLHPLRPAGNIRLEEYQRLAEHIKAILVAAIRQGGTTLRNFSNADGKPGYFKQQLHVYGRSGLPCSHCQQTLEEIRINNRTSVFCPHCQALAC